MSDPKYSSTRNSAQQDPSGMTPQANIRGGLWVDLDSYLSGEDPVADRIQVEQRNNYTYINSTTTTVVKTGWGLLHAITVEGGAAGTITVYDNTAASGTVMANFASTNAPATYPLNILFATGCTIVTSAGTQMTISAR